MDRKAVIDIGTNSIKLYVAELGPDGSLATVIDKNNIARLGEGMDEERTLQQEAIRRNAEAVAEFADLAKSNGAVSYTHLAFKAHSGKARSQNKCQKAQSQKSNVQGDPSCELPVKASSDKQPRNYHNTCCGQGQDDLPRTCYP